MLEYWGLKYNPFTRNINLNNLYFRENFLHIVKDVKKEIMQKNRLVLILGKKNSGKTYLRMYLSDYFRKSGLNIISVESKPNRVLKNLTEEENNDSSDNLLSEIKKCIMSENIKYLLFVDNAHHLEDHTNYRKIINWFQNISMDREVFFKVIMLGEPELSNMVNKSLKLKEYIVQYFINPMDVIETKEYITYKVESTGVKVENIFSSEALDEIFEISHGLPGRVDDVCIRSLIVGAEQKIKIIDRETIMAVVGKMKGVKKRNEDNFKGKVAQENLKTVIIEDSSKNEIDKLLYDEIISFARKIFYKKGDKFYLTDMDEVQKNVARIIGNMLSGNSKLLIMTRQETPDNYLLGHAVNVCILAIELGIGMGYDTYKLNKLGVAAFLHDIGMIDSYSIVDREDRLNIKERMEMKKHPNKGKNIIEKFKKLYIGGDINIINAIKQHHERVDGSGYPLGLKDNEINEFAKIIGIVDVYEALTHKRRHKDRINSTEAIGAIVRTGDNKFGPDIVKTLIKELSFYPVGSFVRLKTGEIGKVIKTNKVEPVKPVIKLIYSANGDRLPDREINLSLNFNYAIKSAIDEKKLKLLRKIDDNIYWK